MANPMFIEENRLKTFIEKGWPSTLVPPEALSKFGFYYTGESDRVKCPFCSVVIFNWEADDDPFLEHLEHSKQCPFLAGRDVGNVSMGTDPCEISSSGQDIVGTNLHIEKLKVIDEESEGPGVQFKVPNSTELVTYDSRLAQFSRWPISDIITPSKLAESGFYYKGPVYDLHGIAYLDFVVCFHCGISLCQWVKGDDPWIEHAKFSPDCIFVHLVAPIPPPSSESGYESESKSESESESESKSESDSKAKSESESDSDSKAKSESEAEAEPKPKLEPESPPKSESESETESKMESKPESKPKPESESKSESTSTQVTLKKCHPFIPFSYLPKPKDEKFCCKVCLDFQVGAVFSPCLHTACPVCASSISSCPICRADIKRIISLNLDHPDPEITFFL